jgi:hypothetical protein
MSASSSDVFFDYLFDVFNLDKLTEGLAATIDIS